MLIEKRAGDAPTEISSRQSLGEIPLAFIDVETTGLSPRFGHRVIEVAAVRVEGGVITRQMSQLINPGRSIGHSITLLTGISAEMVADAPVFGNIIDELYGVLSGAVVVGHNTSFDAAFLRNETSICGRSLCDDLSDPAVLDTLRLARRLCRGQRNGLSALCARLGVTSEHAAHRALGDCHRTLGALTKMIEPHGGFGIAWRELIALHGRVGTLRDRSVSQSQFAPAFPQITAAAG
jgi:DNA polymerase III epsilon subunit family exonuclease